MEPAEVEVLRRALGPLGLKTGLRVVDDTDDELVLVVPAGDFPKLNEQQLTQELTAALGRKIWVVTDAPDWHEKSHPLSV